MLWKRVPEAKWTRYGRGIQFTNCVYAASGPLLVAGTSSYLMGWQEFSGKAALLLLLFCLAAGSLVVGVDFGRNSGRAVRAASHGPKTPDPMPEIAVLAPPVTPDDADLIPALPVMRPANWRRALCWAHLFSLGSAYIATEVCVQIGKAIAAFPGHSPINALFNSCGEALLFLSFFGIPCGIGFACAYFWRDMPEPQWRIQCANCIYANFACTLLGAGFAVGPGIVCSFPVLLMMQALGIYNGYYFWRERPIFGVNPPGYPN